MRFNVLHLDGLTLPDADVIGGKGAGLARLIRAGASVPEGFVIPALVPLSADVVDNVVSECNQLVQRFGPHTRFAVRSSAPVEDSSDHSYAGMYATVLNVPVDGILVAAEACRSSARSDRLTSYRLSRGLSAHDGRLAVVVQRMLNPSAAGVCFTVDPVTGRDSLLVIEAVFGIGEALVSGSVTPDIYWVNKANGAVVDFGAGIQGTTARPVLSIEELKWLCSEAVALSESFGYPLDIEFAFEGGRLYLLQARPVTVWNRPEPGAA